MIETYVLYAMDKTAFDFGQSVQPWPCSFVSALTGYAVDVQTRIIARNSTRNDRSNEACLIIHMITSQNIREGLDVIETYAI